MKISNRQAIEAQFTLAKLLTLELPIKTSMDVALLSNAIDRQVIAFAKVRDELIRKYQIKLKPAEEEGRTQIVSNGEDGEARAIEFNNKINELIEVEGEDITTIIHLPPDINTGSLNNPKEWKPIAEFVRFIE